MGHCDAGARGQAERYAKALPASEGWPPFLIVVDVGHSIELFADFSLTGKAYLPFPGPRDFQFSLTSSTSLRFKVAFARFGLIPTRSTRLASAPASPAKLQPGWPPWRAI